MLRHTFCHIPGIGEKTEGRLWSSGITSWDAILDQEKPRSSPLARRLGVLPLQESHEHYAKGNPAWFEKRLPTGQVWRLFRDFRSPSWPRDSRIRFIPPSPNSPETNAPVPPGKP